MTINLYIFACMAFVSVVLLGGAHAVGSTNKGDGAPWGSYFSRGFGGFYSPDDFAPDPPRRLEHRQGRPHAHDGHDDTQRTLSRGDLVHGEIPAVPDTQSRNVPYNSKQGWTQDAQHSLQHEWAQDTQQDFQDDTQQDFQDDTQQDFQDDTQQQDFQDDIQHDADPQDFTGYRYPPAKGHHRPDVPKHTTPVFHHTTYTPEPPVKHTTYQPEPPVQHTAYQPEPPVQHTTYQPEPPVQHTTYQTPEYPTPYQTPTPEYPTTYPETKGKHTTYPTDSGQHTTTEYQTERTTYGSYDTTTHPGSSDYEMTTYSPHGPSEDGICRSNPAAEGYPPGTKLICTVEVIICDPIYPNKSQKGGTKTTGKSTTFVCKPFNGCDDTGHNTGKPEYTTKDYGYTTEHSGYTTDKTGYTTENSGYTTEGGYTTGKPSYTTEKPDYTTEGGYTTDKPGYRTEKPDYTTEKPVYTTEKPSYTTEKPVYTTEKPSYPTEHPEYPTTHPVTEKPAYTIEHYTPKPTPPPYTTPHDEETTPCVNKSGVKGRSRDCGVKGVKGVKGGYRQPSWSNWSSWNPWSDWESKRQGVRKQQQTSWQPGTQERKYESVRRPVWNGAWPSSFSAEGSAPVYIDF